MNDRIAQATETKKAFIGELDDTPQHLVTNRYITGGYRINHEHSHWDIFHSLFKVHNESVNVWSHLLGLVLFLALIVYVSLCISSLKTDQDHKFKQYSSEALGSNISLHLSDIQQELSDFRIQALPQEVCLQKEDCLPNSEQENGDDYKNQLTNIMNNLAGYTQTLAHEYSALKAFIEEKEIRAEEKILSWKNKVKNFPKDMEEMLHSLEYLVKHKFQENSHKTSRNSFEKLQELVKRVSSVMGEHLVQMDWMALPLQKDHISRWPLFVHMVSACCCLGFSAFYHLFSIYSQRVSKSLSRLDYSGIIILICGSCMPPIHYYFSCGPGLAWKYVMTGVMLTTSLLTFFAIMHPIFGSPQNQKWRGILFIVLGIGAGGNVIVLNFALEKQYLMEVKSLDYAVGGAIYIFGAILYILKAPEKCKPGKFNVCGQSHNLFHFCVVIACFLHYYAGLDCYLRRKEFICPV